MTLKLLVPALYLGLAIYTWINFTRLPPDGLANIGLMVVTLPITLVVLMLTWVSGAKDFVLLPDRLGYYGAHAL